MQIFAWDSGLLIFYIKIMHGLLFKCTWENLLDPSVSFVRGEILSKMIAHPWLAYPNSKFPGLQHRSAENISGVWSAKTQAHWNFKDLSCAPQLKFMWREEENGWNNNASLSWRGRGWNQEVFGVPSIPNYSMVPCWCLQRFQIFRSDVPCAAGDSLHRGFGSRLPWGLALCFKKCHIS